MRPFGYKLDRTIFETRLAARAKHLRTVDDHADARLTAESLNTLKFAARAKRMKNKPILNDVNVS